MTTEADTDRLAKVRQLRDLLKWELEEVSADPELARRTYTDVILDRIAALNAEEVRLERIETELAQETEAIP